MFAVYSLQCPAMSTSLQTSASSGQTLHTALSYCAISQYENTFYTRLVLTWSNFQIVLLQKNLFCRHVFESQIHFCTALFRRHTKISAFPYVKELQGSRKEQQGCQILILIRPTELIIAVNTTSMNGTPPSSCSRVLKVTFVSQKTLKRASLPTMRRV